MVLPAKFNSKVVELAKEASQTPENDNNKAITLNLLFQLKTLAASGNAMAQYRLAQVYPKNSPTSLYWLQAAANQGLTNAMLALSLNFAENGSVAGLQQAAKYLVKIIASGDSYITSEAKALMMRNRLLGVEVLRLLDEHAAPPELPKEKVNIATSPFSFFAAEKEEQEQEINPPTLKS